MEVSAPVLPVQDGEKLNRLSLGKMHGLQPMLNLCSSSTFLAFVHVVALDH